MQFATILVIFAGVMTADFYVSSILKDALLLFIHQTKSTDICRITIPNTHPGLQKCI